MSKLIKLKIVGYSDDTYKSTIPGAPYRALINPDKLKWDRAVQYNDKRKPNSSKSELKYIKTTTEKLSFELVIDCTGVVDSKRTNMPDEINALKKIVYDYNGKIHRPNFIIISWGENTLFKGVLKTFNTVYTLFKPDGTPLRAKISLSFEASTDPVTEAKLENKQSPDVTHIVNVIAGDSLTHISHKIYGKSDYYIQIAEYNKLDKFRHLKPGTQLVLPPLTTEEVT